MRATSVPASLLAVLFVAALSASPVHAADDAPAPSHKAKASLDDRADPRVRTDDVGKPGRMGRKDLAPGAYFNDRHRQAVRAWYAAHAANEAAAPAKWHIGERLPAGVDATPVPKPVLAKLPPVPPGHRYVQASNDILLIATGSKMVVDGISAAAAR